MVTAPIFSQIRYGTRIILCLPPHTTHKSEPLNVGVFALLKVRWSKVCHSFFQKNPGKIITKFNFSSLFSEAWYAAVTPINIMVGFRKAGVYPFDPEAVTLSTPAAGPFPETSPELVLSNHPVSETTLGNSASGTTESAVGDPCTSETSIGDPQMSTTAVGDPLISKTSDPCTSEASANETAETTAIDSGVMAGPSFSQEEKCRFQIRYEEGFDVCGGLEYFDSTTLILRF